MEDDLDEALVVRFMNGESTRLHRHSFRYVGERAEAVRRLHKAGYADPKIALATRLSTRSILRIRNRLGLKSNVPRHPTLGHLAAAPGEEKCLQKRHEQAILRCDRPKGHQDDLHIAMSLVTKKWKKWTAPVNDRRQAYGRHEPDHQQVHRQGSDDW